MIKPEIKTAVILSYYNAEKEIPRWGDDWYDHVDHIIAIDGRYKTPMSPKMRAMNLPNYSSDYSEHVLKTKYGKKLTHDKVYGTQLEKRQRGLDIAGELGVQMAIVSDSDEYIYPSPDWDLFAKQLEAVYYAFPDQRLFQMLAWIPDTGAWSPQYNEVKPNSWVPYTKVHRDPGTMKYVLTHYTWADKSTTLQQIQKHMFEDIASINGDIRDPNFNKYLLKSTMLLDGIKITTDRTKRTPAMLDLGNSWTWQNMHWEQWTYVIEAHWHYWGNKTQFDYMKEKFPDLDYYFDERAILIPYRLKENGEYIIMQPNVPQPVLDQIEKQAAFDHGKEVTSVFHTGGI